MVSGGSVGPPFFVPRTSSVLTRCAVFVRRCRATSVVTMVTESPGKLEALLAHKAALERLAKDAQQAGDQASLDMAQLLLLQCEHLIEKAEGEEGPKRSGLDPSPPASSRSVGRLRMAGYRLYCFDGVSKITGVHKIEADNDADALHKARSIKSGANCELWDRDRLVSKFEGPSNSN